MAHGYLDTQNIDFAVGQTESRLRNMQNRLGINFSEFYSRLDGAMSALNGNNDAVINSLITKTSADRVSGGATGNKVLQRAGEYSIVRPQHGGAQGHLLPLYHHAITLGFTAEALETMTVERFQGEIATTVQGFRKGQRAEVLERLFSDAEFVLDDDGVGTSPGFAGSGTGGNVYGGATPPGVTTLNLYSRVTSAQLDAEIKKVQGYLAAMNGSGALDLLTSASGLALVTALPGFVAAGSPLVRVAAGTAEAVVNPDEFVGVLNGNIRVRQAEGQLNGDGIAIYKSNGSNAVNNPLAWRFSTIWGEGAFVNDRDLFPLANAEVSQYFGIGANNRVGAALIAVAASGTYAANRPTVSR